LSVIVLFCIMMSLRCVPRSLVHSVQFKSSHSPPSFPSKSKPNQTIPPFLVRPLHNAHPFSFPFRSHPATSHPVPMPCPRHAMLVCAAPRRAAPCRKDCGTPGPVQNRFRSDSKTTVERKETSKGNKRDACDDVS
jgi:hypothetical protein